MSECINLSCCDGCCLDGSFKPEPSDICNCCLPGLHATLKFAQDNNLQVSITTIAPTQGQNINGTISSLSSTLVQFPSNPATSTDIFPICNIEMILFASALTGDDLTELITAVSIPTPEECITCCSAELREFLQDSQSNNDITTISTHKNNLFTGGSAKKILGTGLGVVIISSNSENRTAVVNLCFVSKITLKPLTL